MMRLSNIKMKTVVERKKLLDTLRENYARHAAIVEEARKGYVEKAVEALRKRLEQFAAEKRPLALTFQLQMPQDYSEVYRNSIEMLEWNTEEFVELEADEFRQLVRDEWDFTESFYASNASYSETARSFRSK